MRKLDRARTIHKDHVGAVMDVSFSPTGREIVTGSYDRTIRIFDSGAGALCSLNVVLAVSTMKYLYSSLL